MASNGKLSAAHGGYAVLVHVAIATIALIALVACAGGAAGGAASDITGALARAVPVSRLGSVSQTSGSSGGRARSLAPAALRGQSYVALGDSFAAGYGVGSSTGVPVPGCGQSAVDYPRLVAARLDLKLTDVTCAGALTANIISTPQVTSDGVAVAQSSALGPATRIVTITVGGNDLGFESIAESCVAFSASGPIIADPEFSSCRAEYDTHGGNSLAARIDGPVLYGAPGPPNGITAVFAKIRREAPNARVFVVGYPALVPDAANMPPTGCFRPAMTGSLSRPSFVSNSFPFTATDTRYLSSVEGLLDRSMKKAAAAARFDYVSLLAATESHSACASSSSAYVNGITIGSVSKALAVDVSPGSLHPDHAGIEFTAKTVERAILSQPTSSKGR